MVNKDEGLDLLLITAPPVTNYSPPLGPSIVVSQAINDGFRAEHYDLNTELFVKNMHDSQTMDWFYNDHIYEDDHTFYKYFEKYLKKYVPIWLQTISQKKPRYLGFSVFSYRSWRFTKYFLDNYGNHLPECKIIVGGGFIRERYNNVIKYNKKKKFDFVCHGEGEVVISEILKGKINIPGVNGKPQLTPFDLNKMPLPNFSGLNLQNYGFASTRDGEPKKDRRITSQVEASRGCVRKCSFCTVPLSQKGYRYRDGNLVAKEMISTHQQTGAIWFHFIDSLLNGSIKQLNNLCNSLIEKKLEGNFDFYWAGNFIIRPKKLFPDKYFKLMSESGCKILTMAIESGSQKVRDHMRKLIKTEDIFYNLDQAKLWGIDVELLFMVGYPTETEADFLETLELLTKLAPYRDIIRSIKCSWRVNILSLNSQLNRDFDTLDLRIDPSGEWYSDTVNLEISARRYFQFKEHAENLSLNFKQKFSDDVIEMRIEEIKKTSLSANAN